MTRWAYDDLGRMTQRTLPGGQSESFSYDAVGNVKTHTTFNGDTIAFTYDLMNRLATKTLPVPGATGTLANTISYTYTATGQVETVQDNRGTTRYTYDLRDRVKTVTLPEGWTLTYGYDAAGNRTSVATQYGAEAAKTVSFEYDAANRLKRTTSAEGEVTTFTYDAAGNRQTASLPNGTSTTWTYDARNRVTQIEHRKVSDNSLIASHSYLWNAQGLRSRETSLTTTVSHTCEYDYTYDRMGRLTQAAVSQPSEFSCAIGGKTWTYTYDVVGNRLTENNPITPAGVSNFTYDANDRLTVVTGQKQATYEYDAGGNMTRQSSPNPSNSTVTDVRLYRWDADNRLVGFTPPEGQGGAISYVYDAEGELVRETRDAQAGQQPAATDTTIYLADKNLPYSQVLEERDGAGALKVTYQFADGQLIKQVRGGAANYYHANHLSVQTVTDSLGAILTYYNYGPFGELLTSNGSGTTNTRLFAGERFDSVSQSYYLRARWLSPAIGRFSAADPARGRRFAPVTFNKYIYADANPVNVIDPSGRFSLMLAMAVTVVELPIVFLGTSWAVDRRVHNYTVKDPICTIQTLNKHLCTETKVFYALRRFPAPNASGDHLIENDETEWVFVGKVRHEVGDKYIRNIAVPPHFLYPGTVTRTVITESNRISIVTEGTGAGGAAALNELSAKPLWKSVDQNIIDAVE